VKESDLVKLSGKCEEVSQMLKALSHPVRLKTLCALVESEKTVGELVEFTGVSQSGMSQFLSRLKSEGAVSCRREGTFFFYTLTDPKLKKLISSIKEIFCK
jgi:DNA-binding transcriptional ArsR family regulator